MVLKDTISGTFKFYPDGDDATLDSKQSAFKLNVQGYSTILVKVSNYSSGSRNVIVKCSSGNYTIVNNKSKTIDISGDEIITISGYCDYETAGSYTLSK